MVYFKSVVEMNHNVQPCLVRPPGPRFQQHFLVRKVRASLGDFEGG